MKTVVVLELGASGAGAVQEARWRARQDAELPANPCEVQPRALEQQVLVTGIGSVIPSHK